MHVTIGTLFLTFCWVRHFLATMLPADMAKNIASPTIVLLRKLWVMMLLKVASELSNRVNTLALKQLLDTDTL